MTIPRQPFLALVFVTLTTLALSSGCGSDREPAALSLQDLPLYPGASEGESLSGSSLGGLVGGSMQQYRTSDSYDEVLEYYREALQAYKPQVMSHRSELGRQSAISVQEGNSMTTVTVQEFTEEDTVSITFMQVQH